jgi:hypothetical protein
MLKTTMTKKTKSFGALSGAIIRRDQDPKVTTKGKSYGSGLDESRKNTMKQYKTGPLGRRQLLKSDNTNPKSTASERGGFGTTGPALTRTP